MTVYSVEPWTVLVSLFNQSENLWWNVTEQRDWSIMYRWFADELIKLNDSRKLRSYSESVLLFFSVMTRCFLFVLILFALLWDKWLQLSGLLRLLLNLVRYVCMSYELYIPVINNIWPLYCWKRAELALLLLWKNSIGCIFNSTFLFRGYSLLIFMALNLYYVLSAWVNSSQISQGSRLCILTVISTKKTDNRSLEVVMPSL